MLKKILLTIFAVFIASSVVFADDAADVRAFFNKYVSLANSYDKNLLSLYEPNAKIIRVVIKKDGSTKAVPFPMSEYAKQLKLGEKTAKLVGYKNTYSVTKISKAGNDYRVDALRTPSRETYKIPAHFIIGKNSQGQWKIKEESMHTKVQDFLKYAK